MLLYYHKILKSNPSWAYIWLKEILEGSEFRVWEVRGWGWWLGAYVQGIQWHGVLMY